MRVVQIAYPMTADILRHVPSEGQTMAIGDFDGVHLGHREVIRRAIDKAQRLGVASSVMTFHPHPREVLGSPVYSTYITPLDRKLERFANLGVDCVYVVTFDSTLAVLPPDVFVEQVLLPLRVKHISVGFNFTFGHRGIGTSSTLRELGETYFEVDIVEPFLVGGERVSSTLIREALSMGDVARAAAFLGRPYAVDGEVVHGEGRGRTIGVPTANLSVRAPFVAPSTGVYAVQVSIETGAFSGHKSAGVMNVGFKPTFHSRLPCPTWEAHLFNFEGDLYGAKASVEFHSRIRDEQRFDSVDALIRQIQQDIEEAKRRFE
jgi:riboflavin kinase/FMN adenylyltransferase